jgi:phosphate transport system ATP-binding protein
MIGDGHSPATTVDDTPCLDVADLSIAYGGRPALRNVTVAIRTGRITAIVGPSGCGKSTFLASLNRMTDLVPGCAVTGRIRFHGADIHDPATDVVALRTRVGTIFQRPNPFPLSIRRNLTFALEHHRIGDRRAREALAAAALGRVGLWDEVRDRLDAPALKLSGGQQQRLCLARALVLEPDVLLMDEPCSALDPLASGVVEDLIVSLRGRYTIVVVTHNLAQARRIADDVAVFWTSGGAGTLIEHGPAPSTFESPVHDLTAAYVRGIRG